jgi:hypothetical protein
MKAKIENLAAQIAAMKPRSPSEATLYNFVFGALYAFTKAIDLGYLERWNKEKKRRDTELLSMRRARQVKQLAASLSAGQSLTELDWHAGYYYNDALLRADLCYEQLARFKGKVREKGNRKGRKELEDLAIKRGLRENLIKPWWKKVRDDVNSLKHQSIHDTEGPPLNPEDALCVIEHLIEGIKFVFHIQT